MNQNLKLNILHVTLGVNLSVKSVTLIKSGISQGVDVSV